MAVCPWAFWGRVLELKSTVIRRGARLETGGGRLESSAHTSSRGIGILEGRMVPNHISVTLARSLHDGYNLTHTLIDREL